MERLKTFLNGETSARDRRMQTWLLLGGTGTISTGVMEHLRGSALVTCMNRGSRPLPDGVEQIICDVNDVDAVKAAIEGRQWDVIVDFLTYTPDQAHMRVDCFLGHCGRFIFISTATTYEKPPRTLFVSEKTPQYNPYSDYAQKKILCEAVFRDAHRRRGLPLMIIRPSYTYGREDVPFITRPHGRPYALIRRMREGKPILIPGDGSIFWTITHNSDFARALAGLVMHPDTIGEDFHITQDECMTWDAFAHEIARAAGVKNLRIVHVASDKLISVKPSLRDSLLGDKAQTAVFDNSKLRRFLPDFRFLVSFREGVAESVRTLDANPALQKDDPEWDAWMDEMIERFG